LQPATGETIILADIGIDQPDDSAANLKLYDFFTSLDPGKKKLLDPREK
jgi:hypothetical protein